MIDIKTIADHDRASVLHPFTPLKDFATGKLGIRLSSLGEKASALRTQRDIVTSTASPASTA